MIYTQHDRTIRNRNLETQYSPDDFANPESFDSHDSTQRAYVILNAGYVAAIVFAEYPAYTEQDALDEAADCGKLDAFQVSDSELEDYKVGEDSGGYPEYEGILNLGNASEPFALESFDVWCLSASVFAEDPALMTHDRVMVRLEEMRDEADKLYGVIDTGSPDWLQLYKARENARDTYTLARLTGAR